MTRKQLCGAVSAVLMAATTISPVGAAPAQTGNPVYQGLLKIGQIVDPTCTARLYRPLMPKNDYNTWWAPGAPAPDPSKAKLYPGVTITRDQKFGPNAKDLVDIFVGDTGPATRPVFIFVPGGGGNKIEQQDRDANAFYDNIGRWGVKNGFVVVTVQRHGGGANWDDAGRDIANAVDWIHDNIGKYHGDGNRMVMQAHSAGTGPTGVYVGHADRWPHGVQIKGMIYMSGGPIPTILGPQAGRGGGNQAAPGALAPGAACGSTSGQAGTDGAISGPSGATPAAAPGGGGRGGGAPGAPGGGRAAPAPLTPEQQAERDNLPGFKKSNVRLMLVRAELDPGVTGDMTAADHAIHDQLCALDGPGAKDGVGHCPAMLYGKQQSHMGEVFSFDSPDHTVSDPVLAFAKSVTQ